MMVKELQDVISNYHFQVRRYSKLANGDYRLETNHGTKRLSLWSDDLLLEWAHVWREELAQLGYRQVDRFIRNNRGQYYLESEHGFITVQDLFVGEPFNLTISEQIVYLGQFVGEWFRVSAQAFHKLNHPQVRSRLRRKPQAENLQPSELDNLVGSLDQSMFTFLVRRNIPNLKKRWGKALVLEQASQVGQDGWLFPASISMDQWVYLEQGYIGFYASDHGVTPDFQAVAQLLQHLYVDERLSLTDIERFYKAFANAYVATIHTHYNILAHLIFPRQLMEIIHQYKAHVLTAEESVQHWLEAGQRQEKLDQLPLFLAKIMDQEKWEMELG